MKLKSDLTKRKFYLCAVEIEHWTNEVQAASQTLYRAKILSRKDIVNKASSGISVLMERLELAFSRLNKLYVKYKRYKKIVIEATKLRIKAFSIMQEAGIQIQ